MCMSIAYSFVSSIVMKFQCLLGGYNARDCHLLECGGHHRMGNISHCDVLTLPNSRRKELEGSTVLVPVLYRISNL